MALLWFRQEVPVWLASVAEAIGEPVTAFDPRSVTTRGEPIVLIVDTREGDARALCRDARAGFGPTVAIVAIRGNEPLPSDAATHVDGETPAVGQIVERVLALAVVIARERLAKTTAQRRLARARAAQLTPHDEDIIRERELESRELLDALPDAALVERRGLVVFANATAASMLGCSSDELLGSSMLDHVHPDDRAVVEAALLSPLASRKANDARIVRKDGSSTQVELTALLIHFCGEPSTFVVVRDVAERKLYESVIATSDRLASVGGLAAGVAHEINNPLTALISSLDFLDEETLSTLADNSDAGDLLLTAKEASYRIRDIIRDLRLFSRPDEERRGPVDLHATLDSTCRLARVEIRHRARLIKRFGPVPRVDANEARLGQVFLNLVVNAAQAIAEGDVESNEITVSTHTDAQGNAVVSVRDTGRGIPSHVFPKLFEPFFTTKPHGIGTGLGLSISRRIIEDAGGSIDVQSELGGGTEVRVVLPASAPRVEPNTSRPRMVTPSSKRSRLLVVDDDVAVRRALMRILGEHHVTTVSSGAEAIELISSGERFDAVLCDLMMPNVTGDQCFVRVVEIDPKQAERFVFMSGGAFTASARTFLETTGQPTLEKPFDIELLRSAVRTMCEGRA